MLEQTPPDFRPSPRPAADRWVAVDADPRRLAASFGGLPGSRAGASGVLPGAFDPGDGDFGKKKSPLVAILAVLLAAAVGVGVVAIGWEKDTERLAPDQAWNEMKRVKVLPKEEQLIFWRKYAASHLSSDLQEEALKQLAWARDPAGVDLAIAALEDPEQKIRAQAARALAEYGLPDADRARPALLKALVQAKPESRPQITWGLVELGEKAALPKIMELYRAVAG